MATNPRATKPDPARNGPNRGSGPSPGPQSADGAGAAGPTAAHRKVINRAVELAYGVVDDHIRQGQQAAERLRAGTYSSADFDSDLKLCLDRALKLSKEFGVVGVDFFDAVRRMAPFRSAVGSIAADFALEVKSNRRAQVKYDLRSSPTGFSPAVPPLHSADRSKKPLEDVHFVVREGHPVLVVNIPDDHPHGLYTGPIIDSQTHEPGGFISVRVLEEDKH
jgi:hypothetical protein